VGVQVGVAGHNTDVGCRLRFDRKSIRRGPVRGHCFQRRIDVVRARPYNVVAQSESGAESELIPYPVMIRGETFNARGRVGATSLPRSSVIWRSTFPRMPPSKYGNVTGGRALRLASILIGSPA